VRVWRGRWVGWVAGFTGLKSAKFLIQFSLVLGSDDLTQSRLNLSSVDYLTSILFRALYPTFLQ
jgi:hypothetical protein